MTDEYQQHSHQQDAMARVTAIQVRYTEILMHKAYVVGVAVGLRKIDEVYTDELCLVVMVVQKLPAEQLPPEDRIPDEIEGVPVEVQEVGFFQAY